MLILKIDPKLVETMLSLAKGEHAVALHNMQEEPAGDGRRRGRAAVAATSRPQTQRTSVRMMYAILVGILHVLAPPR